MDKKPAVPPKRPPPPSPKSRKSFRSNGEYVQPVDQDNLKMIDDDDDTRRSTSSLSDTNRDPSPSSRLNGTSPQPPTIPMIQVTDESIPDGVIERELHPSSSLEAANSIPTSPRSTMTSQSHKVKPTPRRKCPIADGEGSESSEYDDSCCMPRHKISVIIKQVLADAHRPPAAAPRTFSSPAQAIYDNRTKPPVSVPKPRKPPPRPKPPDLNRRIERPKSDRQNDDEATEDSGDYKDIYYKKKDPSLQAPYEELNFSQGPSYENINDEIPGDYHPYEEIGKPELPQPNERQYEKISVCLGEHFVPTDDISELESEDWASVRTDDATCHDGETPETMSAEAESGDTTETLSIREGIQSEYVTPAMSVSSLPSHQNFGPDPRPPMQPIYSNQAQEPEGSPKHDANPVLKVQPPKPTPPKIPKKPVIVSEIPKEDHGKNDEAPSSPILLKASNVVVAEKLVPLISPATTLQSPLVMGSEASDVAADPSKADECVEEPKSSPVRPPTVKTHMASLQGPLVTDEEMVEDQGVASDDPKVDSPETLPKLSPVGEADTASLQSPLVTDKDPSENQAVVADEPKVDSPKTSPKIPPAIPPVFKTHVASLQSPLVVDEETSEDVRFLRDDGNNAASSKRHLVTSNETKICAADLVDRGKVASSAIKPKVPPKIPPARPMKTYQSQKEVVKELNLRFGVRKSRPSPPASKKNTQPKDAPTISGSYSIFHANLKSVQSSTYESYRKLPDPDKAKVIKKPARPPPPQPKRPPRKKRQRSQTAVITRDEVHYALKNVERSRRSQSLTEADLAKRLWMAEKPIKPPIDIKTLYTKVQKDPLKNNLVNVDKKLKLNFNHLDSESYRQVSDSADSPDSKMLCRPLPAPPPPPRTKRRSTENTPQTAVFGPGAPQFSMKRAEVEAQKLMLSTGDSSQRKIGRDGEYEWHPNA